MTDTDLTLVTGATGNTGSGVAGALVSGGHAVRALVRDPAKAASLGEGGADLVVADLDDPSTLDATLFDGVTRVYFCTWNGPTALQHWQNFREALASSGAEPHIVRLSGFGAAEARIIADLHKADQDLKASGLPWTILQPTFFMQNVMMAAGTVKEQGAIYWDWAEGRAGMIDVRDVVDSAVGALTSEGGDLEGQSLVLTGPRSIGFAEVAKILSGVLGKDVNYVPVPHEAASEAMLGMGMPEWIVAGYAELSEGFMNGFADRTTDNVERLAGHPPRDFEEFANDFKGAFE
jgi:uncharacterized protein YbjT (DUF2867 family)